MTVNDAKFAKLRGLGHTGSISDMTLQWLQANGATSPAIPDAWLEMLTAKGFGPGAAPTPQNVIQANGSNFVIGTATPASNIVPDNINGLAIFYLGSFGENFWNLRMGDNTEQIPGVTEVTVQLGGSPADTILWNGPAMKYQGPSSANLWSTIGAAGTLVGWSIKDQNGVLLAQGESVTTIGPFHRNDNWYAYLGSLGHTGSMNDRELQFWESP